jgi:hypothetical protein
MSENKLDNEFFINRDPEDLKKKEKMRSEDFVYLSRRILGDPLISLEAKGYYAQLEAGSIIEADIPVEFLKETIKIYYIIGTEVSHE